MKKLTKTILIASLLGILSGGCIVIPYYAGPDESEPRVLAVRDEPGVAPDASQVRHLESPDAGIPYHPHVGVSLYDYRSDRMLWTVPDWWVVSSRTDIDRFITCSGGGDTDHYAEHSVLRLRDGSGAELVRREVAASHLLVAPSPSLKRVSYLIIKKWGKKFAEIEDAQLCVETFGGGMSVCRKTFDVAFERQSFRWLTDDVVIGTSFKHRFGKEHGYVVLDVRTGKWHQLPFPAESYSSFVVDESNGFACLGAGNGRFHICDARIDAVSATFSLSDSGFPRDPGGLRMIGVENGVGVVFAGMRTWMLVGWDGSLVRSGTLIRSGIGTIDRYIGHERLAVSMFRTGESAVLSLCNRLMAKGARSMPYVDGKFLLGDPNW